MTDSTRNLIRGVSVGIIVLTIPFYLCGIVLWSTSSNDGSSNRPATLTPIDPGNINTQRPTITPLFTEIDPSDFRTPATATNTPQRDIDFDQVVPTNPPPPTVTNTRTPSPTAPPTDTLAPTLTIQPTSTDTPMPILPPASDTPVT